MKYFVDTNIFLRTLIKEDEQSFSDCCRFLEAIKTNKLQGVISSLILAETVWTLASFYQFPKEKVAGAARSIINLRGLKIVDRFDHRWALNAYEEKKIKYIDALIASIKEIKEKKWTIVSYDRDLDNLKVLRKEPPAVLSHPWLF